MSVLTYTAESIHVKINIFRSVRVKTVSAKINIFRSIPQTFSIETQSYLTPDHML